MVSDLSYWWRWACWEWNTTNGWVGIDEWWRIWTWTLVFSGSYSGVSCWEGSVWCWKQTYNTNSCPCTISITTPITLKQSNDSTAAAIPICFRYPLTTALTWFKQPFVG